MLNETHHAPPRYKIPEFFSSLLGLSERVRAKVEPIHAESVVPQEPSEHLKQCAHFQWSAQRTSIWVCLQNRRAISSAFKSWCLKCPKRGTPEALQGPR